MLAVGCLRTPICSTETLLDFGLATSYGRNGEVLRVFAPQRDCVAEHAEFERVAANRGTGELDLSALHQAENHQPLHHRIAAVHRLYDVFLAPLER